MKIKLGKNQPLPKYHSTGAAAFDLVATRDSIIADDVDMMDLEIACEFPYGFYGELVVRSSMAKRGIMLANSVGIIDNDYRGNIHAPLCSRTGEPVEIKKGERIVQVIIKPLYQPKIEPAEELSETERGAGGFGSTNTCKK